MDRVTAVVVNYHGVDDVVQAVCSMLADEPGLPVVVVDNSENATEFERLSEQLAGMATVLDPGRNLGFGGGCNFAAQHRPADFFWLVNPDVRVRPGCLTALLGAMDVQPRRGAVAPRMWLDDDLTWAMSPAWLPSPLSVRVRTRALHEGSVRHRLGQAVRREAARFWRAKNRVLDGQRTLSGAALLVRRVALERDLQIFDPRYFMYFEDTDLCWGLRRRGWDLSLVSEAEVIHHWRMAPHKNEWMEISFPLFQSKFFNVGLNRIPDVNKNPGDENVPPERMVWERGMSIRVPPDWVSGWMLELSPLPVFLPSIGRLGQGAEVCWPAVVSTLAPDAPWFARLSGDVDGGEDSIEYRLR